MITLTWADSDKQLLKWDFGQRWSRGDFLDACQEAHHMVETANHPVNLLIDLSASRFYPLNLMSLVHAGIQMKTEKSIEKVVVVSSSKLWSRLYLHLIRVYPMDTLPVDFVSSYQDPMQKLQTPIFNRVLAQT